MRRRSTCFLLSDTWPFGFNSRRRQILRIERTGGRGTASMPPWHESLETSDQCRWDPTSSEFIQLARNPGYQNPCILSLWEVWSFSFGIKRVQKSGMLLYSWLYYCLVILDFLQRTTEPSRSLCSISYGNSSDSYGSRQRDWNIMNSLAFSLMRESKIIQNCLVSMGKPRKPKGKWGTHILGTRHMSKTHLCLAILGWTWTAWYQSFDLLSGTCSHWAAWGGAKHHSSKGATQLGKDPDISPMFCNRRPSSSLNNYWKMDSTFSTWFSHVQKPFPHIPIVFMKILVDFNKAHQRRRRSTWISPPKARLMKPWGSSWGKP